jgi:hypothetical protein
MSITRKGYNRIRVCGKQRMEHDLVWEAAYGPIPHGFLVHHIDENKLNNRLDNLQLMDFLTHKRIHGGCELRNGVWWKPCTRCGVFYRVADYYSSTRGILSRCRPCCIASAVANKRARRMQSSAGQDEPPVDTPMAEQYDGGAGEEV